MKAKRTSKLKRAAAERAKARSQQRLVRRLEAENVMLKNYNGQLNAMLDAWYASFGTNQLTHALARLEAAEKRAAKSSNNQAHRSSPDSER